MWPKAGRGLTAMMLATRCPYCRTTFRVVQDQLKICNGIVRCGSCRQVFNGIEQLQSAEAAVLAEASAAQGEASWPESAQANPNPMTIVAEEDDKSGFTEAHEDLNLILAPAEESFSRSTSLIETPDPVYADETDSGAMAQEAEEPQPDLVLHVDERKEPRLEQDFPADASDAHDFSADHHHDLAPSQGYMLPSGHTGSVVDDEDEPAYKVELRSQAAEPAFVQRARRQERFGRIARISMAVLILLLLPALLLQTVDAFHQRLSATFPLLRPVLAQVCGVIECQTELASQIEAVSVDSSELHAPTNGEKSFALNLLLRNRSPLAQNWPYIELTLNDAEEKPVVRRVFSALEYLDHVQDGAKGFVAHSERSFRLVFEVEPPLKPVGYRVYVFYP